MVANIDGFLSESAAELRYVLATATWLSAQRVYSSSAV